MRLDKYLADALQITRSASSILLKKKQVTVNGVIVSKGDYQVLETDNVMVDSMELIAPSDVYIMMNKDSGVVCTTDSRDGISITSLLPYKNINPIGRLDKDTTGLIILTSRGDVIHNVTSPKNNIEKEYIVTVEENISEENLKDLESEMTLSNGKRGSYIAKALKVERKRSNEISITITEGKYHEIKEMVKHANLTLTSLKRTRIGDVVLDSTLKCGEYRKLSKEEIAYIEGVK